MTPTTRRMMKVGFLFATVNLATLAQAQTADTRIGKPDLEVGYLSRATAAKRFDEMDFQRAILRTEGSLF